MTKVGWAAIAASALIATSAESAELTCRNPDSQRAANAAADMYSFCALRAFPRATEYVAPRYPNQVAVMSAAAALSMCRDEADILNAVLRDCFGTADSHWRDVSGEIYRAIFRKLTGEDTKTEP